MQEIILASASPRRSELLKQIDLKFHTFPADIDEVFDTELSPEDLVKKLSFQKAWHVAEEFKKRGNASCIVIGADTVVAGDKLLGKPKSSMEAFLMLQSLSGKWHEVITGITLIHNGSGKTESTSEKTRVKMRVLSDDEIRAYINSGEPADKAGAYGIQGLGAVLIEKIEGCYFNVVGLPIAKLVTMLKDFEVYVL